MGRENWVVICGKVRDENEFKLIAQLMIQLRDEGAVHTIILSTWYGSVDIFKGLRQWLRKKEILIVETLEPQSSSFGYILHQKKTLLAGLSLCPDDAYVLKIRTDKVDLANMAIPEPERNRRFNYLKKVLLGEEKGEECNNKLPSLFEDRIFIRLARLDYFFFIADIYFYGKKVDLISLASLDMTLNTLYGRISASAEINYFSMPFLKAFPILAEYFLFAVPSPRRKKIEEKVDGRLRRAISDVELKMILDYELESDFYLKALATYLLILDSHFYLGNMGGTLEKTDDFDLRDVFINGLNSHLTVSNNESMETRVLKSQELIHRILYGDWKNTTFLKRFREIISEVSNPEFHEKRREVQYHSSYEGLEYQRGLQKILGVNIPSLKVSSWEDDSSVSFPLKNYLFPNG